jgi:septal ring factor EnvC (AmiA/AmiB activator)
MSLSDSQHHLQGSIDTLTGDRLALVEKRKLLEAQFSNLTSTIVQKQDRQEQLKERLLEIAENPQMALFSAMQGQLTDPTEGTVRHHFAEPKAQGLLQWEGLVIDAPPGQEINAVFDGTVVFADHMQGLGNVAIVDHGEGYMSLYGMTDFLVVQTGQQVLTGETVGTTGSTIGNDASGLYFEVRHNANTLNPAEWLEMSRISPDTGS